ncbi:MAG: carboxylesterase/lipase family protein [Leucobacter sp.]
MAESPSNEAPIVQTPSGKVRGVWQESTAVFRGIPYAEEPTGPLRFARPVRREPWDGIFDATEFGPTPMHGKAGAPIIPEESIPGNDILSVNVWTPTLDPESKLPVVVWIHGGGFITGSPASPWYDGRAFARDGVILVTLSYRLGFRGFGWIEGAVPNRGVLDWICALEWVQQHIHAFGGDADKVTIAGQSAGGGAVLTLLGAPGATGMFRAGYAMSAAVADPSVEEARIRSAHLAKLTGVTNDALGFSKLSESKLLEMQPKITQPAPPHMLREVHQLLRDGLMIGPVADGEIVPTDTVAATSLGANASVPLVLGSTEGELVGMFGDNMLLDRAPRRLTLRALGATAVAADRWLDTPMAKGQESTIVLLERYTTDAVFHTWVPRVAAARAESGAGPTWTYRFTWHATEPAHSGHCIDIPFVFDRLDAPGVERVAGSTPPQGLADSVHGALVAFARDLDPGWQPDDAGTGPSHIFDVPERESPGAYSTARALLG